MSKKDHLTRKEVTEVIAFWKDALGLNLWTITESIEVPTDLEDNLTLMTLHRHRHYTDASLVIHPWAIGKADPPGTQNGTGIIEERLVSKWFFEYKIVHELLHAVVRDFSFVFESTLEGFLHRDVDEQFTRAQNHAEEQLVDNLAKALVSKFGLHRDT